MTSRGYIYTLFVMTVAACGDDGGSSVPAECGNGILDGAEVCDDANTSSGDGCSASCNSMEVCGNGILDVGESCDDGNTVAGDGCSPSCKSAFCGNGVLDGVEVCDDGNTTNGDGCNATCSSNETCGNGVLDQGESCDDGDTTGGDGCSATCASEFCGNGVVENGEVCDDGDNEPGDGCNASCSSDESCGNGVLDPGEECEPAVGTMCTSTCVIGHPYLYTVRSVDSVLERYDLESGELEVVGLLGVTFNFGDLAFDAKDGVMFMIDGRGDESLYTVDIDTGAATRVGPHGVTDLFGLVWDPRTDTLYASVRGGGFYRLDQSTGAATLLDTPETSYDGLAYDSRRDRIVGAYAGEGGLYSVDPATGAGTSIATPSFVDNCGLAYDPTNDLYWAFDYSGNLYTWDPTTSAARTLVSDGFGTHDGTLFLLAAPPPPT